MPWGRKWTPKSHRGWFSLALLSRCGGGGISPLGSDKQNQRQREKARSLPRGALPEWEVVMEEFLIKDGNEISRQRGAKPATVSSIWWDSQNVSGDWISFLAPKRPLLKADGMYALHRKILQDAPKAVEMNIKKHPQGLIIWVAIEEGQKGRDSKGGAKMEFCRKKRGKSWEVDSGLGLERGLEGNHWPGTGSLKHTGMFVLYPRTMSVVSGRDQMVWKDQDAERQSHGLWGLLAHSLCVTAGDLCWSALGRTGLWPRSRAVSSDTSEDLTSVVWPFSCATSCLSCSILKTWSRLQIMSCYSSWAQALFQNEFAPLASFLWLVWPSLVLTSCPHHLPQRMVPFRGKAYNRGQLFTDCPSAQHGFVAKIWVRLGVPTASWPCVVLASCWSNSWARYGARQHQFYLNLGSSQEKGWWTSVSLVVCSEISQEWEDGNGLWREEPSPKLVEGVAAKRSLHFHSLA